MPGGYQRWECAACLGSRRSSAGSPRASEGSCWRRWLGTTAVGLVVLAPPASHQSDLQGSSGLSCSLMCLAPCLSLTFSKCSEGIRFNDNSDHSLSKISWGSSEGFRPYLNNLTANRQRNDEGKYKDWTIFHYSWCCRLLALSCLLCREM